jgi:hypothetical protein
MLQMYREIKILYYASEAQWEIYYKFCLKFSRQILKLFLFFDQLFL